MIDILMVMGGYDSTRLRVSPKNENTVVIVVKKKSTTE